MKVRLCEKNKGKNKVLRDLQKNVSDIDVKIKKCIDMCSECSKFMIAKVNDKEIVGKNSEDLVAKIDKRMKDK